MTSVPCVHSKYYECFLKTADYKLMRICLKCFSTIVTDNQQFSRLIRIKYLQETLDLISNSLEIISTIGSECLCEIMSDFSDDITLESNDNYNDICCKLIIMLLERFDRDLTMNCLCNYLNDVFDKQLDNSHKKYLMIISSFCVHSLCYLITFAKINKVKFFHDIEMMLNMNGYIQSVVCYILNVLIDEAPELVTGLNMANLSCQLVDIIINCEIIPDHPLCTNATILMVLLLKYSDTFHEHLMEITQTSFVIRKLILSHDKNIVYTKYGIKILDLLLSSESNGSIVAHYFSQSSNITEYLFDLLITGKSLIPRVIKCLTAFVDCKIFCQTNICAYGLINVLRCCQNYLDGENVKADELEITLKFFNDILLNYNGNVMLFVNESTARNFLSLLTSIMNKSIKSLFLLGLQALIIFLNRYYSVRPFPYEQLIIYLDLFEAVNGKMFRRSNRRQAGINDKSIETILKNRCVFINLHTDFIFELIRFATIDRSNLVLSEEIILQINSIHGFAYSIFFSTYLRYMLSLIKRKKYLNLLSVVKFLEVTHIVLSSNYNYVATKSSLKMIFPHLINALFILKSEIRSENYIFDNDILERVILDLIDICTLDLHIDEHNWRKVISKGILSITDCSLEGLIILCGSVQSDNDTGLTSFWLLSSLVEMNMDSSSCSIRDNDKLAMLAIIKNTCTLKLLESFAGSPVMFSVKFIKLIKILLDTSDNSTCKIEQFYKDFIANLCLSQNIAILEPLNYLLIEMSILKTLNHESAACMGATQMMIYKYLVYNSTVVYDKNVSVIFNCNLLDLVNIAILSFTVILNKDVNIINSLNILLRLVEKPVKKSNGRNFEFSEMMAKSLIEKLWLIPDKLYLDELFQNDDFRTILWQSLNVAFMCSSIYTETVPLLKIAFLVSEFIKRASMGEMEEELIFKLILKMSVKDASFNVRSQLVTLLCNNKEGRLCLSMTENDSVSVKYLKLMTVSTFVLDISTNNKLDHTDKVHVSGQFLLQCIDHCCKIKTSLSQICGLIILHDIFGCRSLVDTRNPCLMNSEYILQIISILYTVIIDRSQPVARHLAVQIFRQILQFCARSSEYCHLEQQIIGSVWMGIIVQNLLCESTANDNNDFIYNETCLEFLGQLLESSSSAINLSVSSDIWRSFSVWFVQHSLADLPHHIAVLVSQLIIKLTSHSKLACFSETEKICLLKKLASDNKYQDGFLLAKREIDPSEFLRIIDNKLDV